MNVNRRGTYLGGKVSISFDHSVSHQTITFFVFSVHSIAYFLNVEEAYFVIFFLAHIEEEHIFFVKNGI